MGIGATILMIIAFPLNSLLLFHEGLSSGRFVQADGYGIETAVQGSVKGTEIQKIPEPIKLKAQAVDNPKYKTVRNENVSNLVLPNAHAFAIIDADTGELLAGNHPTDERQIASLTKMMTATLAMEKIKDLDEAVTIGEEEVYIEGTKVGCPRSGYCISQRLKIDEKISARNLLQAMLMNSANDAAIALAKHMSGTQESFAEVMNLKAKQLGLSNTHFCTASGLEIDGRESECYSSAYDIGRIAAYSMRYDYIWKVFRQPSNTKVASMDGNLVHTILNTDLILNEVPDVIGGKTGFTPLAGYSLLMGATDPTGKHRIIAVLLDDSHRWQDIRTAIDWTFKAYTWQ
ncbi:MAG: Serine-type D-Ala-D-Ala carboxypeptidase [Candidatus Moranbacteria bacterium GW2011_GWC2_37_8]|nr:MAG: Serine-type D-Ala-D-Ala carboxypeptidase [Candidatus Moranbacteria bacterium GW2011_GWC2_37_8]KKQ62927.1 MAG: D-alanyl-D-alanine carboxypeptidase [Parcubacteria group bacterium GW2011_GWC1_38_22]KKQ81224.1 MAG: Serine-type D-Ala-D-Ala carboxypeptidase [Candidatus Moranbacteria bacterium GW2011_GWD2_38_7]